MSQPAAERLAILLPLEVIEQLERVLPGVDHAGTTRVELHHDRSGRITDAEISAPALRVRVRRRLTRGGIV